jgi:hypothetical protein
MNLLLRFWSARLDPDRRLELAQFDRATSAAFGFVPQDHLFTGTIEATSGSGPSASPARTWVSGAGQPDGVHRSLPEAAQPVRERGAAITGQKS